MSSKGLGRGLDALLRRTDMGAARQEKNDTPEKETGTEHSPTLLPLSHLHANPSQPRQTFDAESLAELAASIREQGIIQPLLVRPLADRPGHYQIVAGERRWRAARQAGLGQVPVHVREMSDAEVMAAALIENLQREDLNPIEAANAMKQLMDEYRLTQEELAERIGKSRPAVTNTLRLLSLSPEVISLVSSGRLSAGHARALVTLPEDAQYKIATDAIRDGLSVRDVERSVRDYFATPEEIADKKDKKKQQVSIELKDLIERMRHTFKTKVSLIGNDKKGRIYIDYYNTDDLDRISEIVDLADRELKS